MKKHSFYDVFEACVNGKRYRNRPLSHNDMQMYRFLRAAQEVFKIHYYYGGAYTYKDESLTFGWQKSRFVALYEEQLSNKRAAGRKYYDVLVRLAPDNKCQVCLLGKVESLDHFLPKESYPSLSISPYNLVPCCLGCNGVKSTFKPSSPKRQAIHYKFDDIFSSDWLQGEYDCVNRKVVFSPNTCLYPEGSVAHARIATHMEVHGLHSVYELEALRKTREMVAYAKVEGISLEEHIHSELSKLADNARFYPRARHTFDHWKWVTCKALLASSVFMQSDYQWFENMKRYYLPSEGFEGL
ncbi:hypothetical protein OC926_09950 [Pseudomonas peradeniyensis]|uniref:hypothetical protein n=1 Tax=Pseudomonas TaxID=286 RepID=UPI000A41C1A4|nr:MULTISPECIES: hypothetical protein [Pseudomonas]MCU7280162.1 hypothetical protein [Pseudomonas peradeniyensis]QZA53688.1 hypothetical protein K2O50_22275 [Pseudomonas sp. 2hn]